jgi:two-component system alkaline phosphatase synthesis response regulator PhoP
LPIGNNFNKLKVKELSMDTLVYCVEDDENIRDLVLYALKASNYKTKGFGDSKSFFSELKTEIPSLILLDIMLPDEDGISILKRLRLNDRTKKVPVIMLTARATEYDKVIGLDSGADDYVTKPFGVMELLSRIKAVLRRIEGEAEVQNNAIEIEGVVLDAGKHKVTVLGRPISLTYKEFELLEYLMQNRGLVLSRDKLLDTIWNYEYEGESRTVDVHIGSLRQKLGKQGNIIETIRGIGYKIGGGL